MRKIYENLAVSLDRADQLLVELLTEYERSLTDQKVSGAAVERTHDICEKLRGILDRTARRYWDLHVSPHLSERDRDAAAVYFPVAKDEDSFLAFLGRWRWQSVADRHQELVDYLRSCQPFTNATNKWLAVVADLAIKSKHLDLIPQKRAVARQTTVSRSNASVSWTGGVSFHGNVSVMGAPIDERTQRIVPTAGVTERVEEWVSFMIDGHQVNAAALCTESCKKTREMVVAMTESFEL